MYFFNFYPNKINFLALIEKYNSVHLLSEFFLISWSSSMSICLINIVVVVVVVVVVVTIDVVVNTRFKL